MLPWLSLLEIAMAAFTPFVINIPQIQKRAIESSTGKKTKGSFVVGSELFTNNYKIGLNMATLTAVPTIGKHELR